MSQPNLWNGQTTETFRIVGLSSHAEALKKLAKANPDWNLAPDAIVDNGKAGHKIYRLKFVSKPVELRPDSSSVTVIVAGQEIGYIHPEDISHVKDILDNYDVQSLACGIRGGQYKTVDEFYDVTTQQQGIAATVRIVYSNTSFPFDEEPWDFPLDDGTPEYPQEETEKTSKKAKAKKPIFKHWWFWAIIVLVALIAICCVGKLAEEAISSTVPSKVAEVPESKETAEQTTEAVDNITEAGFEFTQYYEEQSPVYTEGKYNIVLAENGNLILDSVDADTTTSCGFLVEAGQKIKVIASSLYGSPGGIGLLFTTSSEEPAKAWTWDGSIPIVDYSDGSYDPYCGNTNQAWTWMEYEVIVPDGAVMAWIKKRDEVPSLHLYVKKSKNSEKVSQSENDLDYITTPAEEEKLNTTQPDKAIVLFNFDAGHTYDIRATKLEEYGWHGTFCSNEHNQQNVNEFISHGHDIALYSGKYGENLPSDYISDESYDDWYNHIKGGVEELNELGIFDPTLYGCGMHKGGVQLFKACEALGFKYISCSYELVSGDSWDTDPNVVWFSNETNSPDTVGLKPTGMDISIEDLTTILNTAVENKQVISLFTHCVEDTVTSDMNISTEKYVSILNLVKSYVDNGQMEVMTMREFYNKFHANDGREAG